MDTFGSHVWMAIVIGLYQKESRILQNVLTYTVHSFKKEKQVIRKEIQIALNMRYLTRTTGPNAYS